MGILATPARRRTAAAFTFTAFTLATAVSGASAASASAAARHPSTPNPDSAVIQTVSSAAQRATQSYWTRAAMKSATPLAVAEPQKGSSQSGSPGPPPKTPHPTPFNGVPTVGALFMTNGLKRHFCTASVVNSLTADLVLTAAHCVYGSSPATHIEFVPGYHDGLQPYGAWPVQTVTVASGWQKSH